MGAYAEADVKEILHNASNMILRHLRRKGFMRDDEVVEEPSLDNLFSDHPDLENKYRECLRLPVQDTAKFIAPGFGYEAEETIKKSNLCFAQNGFQIHAATRVNPLDRNALDRLLGCMARPTMSEKILRSATAK